MPSFESFLKTNAQKLEFLKWFILPVVMAAVFFFLDGRYISKDDWKTQNEEQKSMIVNLSNEQKAAFTQLTKAITALTEEQRNTAEYQRMNATAIAGLTIKVDKHEASDLIKWDRTYSEISKIEGRLDKAEAEIARHDIAVQLHLKKED
jgi:hypothetical protein